MLMNCFRNPNYTVCQMYSCIFNSKAIRNVELEGAVEFLSPVAHMSSNHAP